MLVDFAGAAGNSNSSNQGLEIQFQAPFYDDPPPPNGKKGDIWRVVNAFSADADAPINTIPPIRNEVSFSLKWLSSLLGRSRVSKPNWTHTECKMGLEIESWNETKMEFWEKIWISENLQKLLLQWLLKLHSISAISDLCLWKSYENVVLHDFLETHTEARIIILFISSITKCENFRYFESKFTKKSHFKLFSVKFHLRHLQGDLTSFG